jgi:hypothetical protein
MDLEQVSVHGVTPERAVIVESCGVDRIDHWSAG